MQIPYPLYYCSSTSVVLCAWLGPYAHLTLSCYFPFCLHRYPRSSVTCTRSLVHPDCWSLTLFPSSGSLFPFKQEDSVLHTFCSFNPQEPCTWFLGQTASSCVVSYKLPLCPLPRPFCFWCHSWLLSWRIALGGAPGARLNLGWHWIRPYPLYSLDPVSSTLISSLVVFIFPFYSSVLLTNGNSFCSLFSIPRLF